MALTKDPNEMDMPCPCSCGEWFDLLDGHRNLNPYSAQPDRVICPDCHLEQLKIQNEIDRLESEIETREIAGRGTKRLEAKLKKIQWD